MAFEGRKSIMSMLLGGLLKRLLKEMEVRLFEGSILNGDPALSYLFLCWNTRRLFR